MRYQPASAPSPTRSGRRHQAPVLALVFALVLAACRSTASGPVVVLHATDGDVPVRVELARTREELSRGLMWRNELAADAGMLFVFEAPAPRTFWMKNTPLSLDILYIDDSGLVLNVAESTTPYSDAPIRSAGPARYVLEVNAGFARRHGVSAGTKVDLPAETLVFSVPSGYP